MHTYTCTVDMYQQKVCVTEPTNVSEKRLSSSTLDLMGPTCWEPAMVEIFTCERMGEVFTCRDDDDCVARKIFAKMNRIRLIPSQSSLSPHFSILLFPLSLHAHLTVIQQHLYVVCSTQDEHVL